MQKQRQEEDFDIDGTLYIDSYDCGSVSWRNGEIVRRFEMIVTETEGLL